jgi:DNA-binding LacI/PurR family transcriptional regulator
MRVTQQDIARIANVSQATVSRVLAGDEKVETSIRNRVREVMRKHNYQPDVRARSLRNRRTGLIGLVVHRPIGGLGDDPFFASLVSEILDRLSGQPYHLCMDVVANDAGHQTIYEEMLRTRRVDGMILVESESRDARLKKLEEDDFPFVLIGNPLGLSEVYSVDNDNVFAGEIATRHLLDEGFHRVGFLGGRPGITVSDDRIAGYQRAIRNTGQEHLIWHSDFGSRSALDLARSVLGQDDRPDAIVVLDDFMAMGVVSAAREWNLRIPQDLAIVGFNDSNVCNLLDCGLTSVSLNISAIVGQVISTLLSIIEGTGSDLSRRVIVPCDLTVRGSSQGKRQVRR